MDGYGYKFNKLPAKEKLTASNYEAWSLSIPVNFYTQGSQAWLDTKRDVENWDKSDEAGYQTILLNISPNYRFIVQQNQGVTALQLWTAIMLLNRNNTKGHGGLVRQRWQSCKQSSKQSLDEYIAAYGKVHSDLLLLGVVYDREAELSQFLAGLDDRRHPTNGLAVLDFPDSTHLGIP